MELLKVKGGWLARNEQPPITAFAESKEAASAELEHSLARFQVLLERYSELPEAEPATLAP